MSAWQGNTNADYRALYDRRAGDEQEVQLHYSAFPVIRRLEETLDVATSIRYSKVLDVGCGDGIFLSKLINSCKVPPDSISWIGVDISYKRLKRAKRSGAEVVVTDAVALPFSREQ